MSIANYVNIPMLYIYIFDKNDSKSKWLNKLNTAEWPYC